MPITSEQYQKYALPALAVIESIATKGERPGTTALQQQQIFSKAQQEQDERKRKALQDKLQQHQLTLSEYKLGEAKRKREAGEQSTLRQQKLREQLGLAESPEERQQIISQYAAQSDPMEYLKMIAKQQEPDFFDKLAANLAQFKAKEEFKSERKQKEKEKERKRETKQFKKQFTMLKNMGDDVPAAGRIGGFLESAQAMVGANPEVKAYEDMVDAFAGTLAKNFGGESGRLTDQDIARIKKMAYKTTDTPAERKIKKGIWNSLGEADDDMEIQEIIWSVKLPEEKQEQEEPQEQPSDQFTPGQVYTDAQGNSARYLGNGEWEEL